MTERVQIGDYSLPGDMVVHDDSAKWISSNVPEDQIVVFDLKRDVLELMATMTAEVVLPAEWVAWMDEYEKIHGAYWKLLEEYRATHRKHRGRKRHVKRWLAQQRAGGLPADSPEAPR